MLNKKWLKAGTISAVAVAMAGCSGGGVMNASKVVQDEYQRANATTTQKVTEGYAKTPAASLFSRDVGFYVDRQPLMQVASPLSQLPPIFQKSVNMNFQAVMSLTEVFERLTKMTGLLFSVSQDVYESNPQQIALALSAPAPGAGPVAPAAGATSGGAPARPEMKVDSSQGSFVDVKVKDIIYSGGVAGLLDALATKTNLVWKWDGEKVQFYRYETRAFKINALNGKAIQTASVQSGTAGSSATSTGSAQSGAKPSATAKSETSMDTYANMWEEIGLAIQSMLSPRGKMSLMPSVGSVTVTDTPERLRLVETHIKRLNRDLEKQVMVNVQVYAIEAREGDAYGVDWTGVWQTLAAKYNLSFKTAGNTTGISSLFSAGILANTVKDGVTSKNNGPWNGSSTVIGALSSLGRTSLVTSGSLTTLNNMPVPLNVLREQSYVQSISTTVTGSSGTAQTSIVPGLVTTGFSMTLTPRLSDTEKLTMQYSMNLSDLISLDTFTAPGGTASVQLPTQNIRTFLQRVGMRSGETLILSGFQQSRMDNQGTGPLNGQNWFLGGKKTATATTTTLVIMITPYVVTD